jgi:hypothetical protein
MPVASSGPPRKSLSKRVWHRLFDELCGFLRNPNALRELQAISWLFEQTVGQNFG